MKATQEIKIADIPLVVDYEYALIEGDYNIDDYEHLMVESIHTEGDIAVLLDNYVNTNKILQEIKEKLLPYARDSYFNKD